MDTLDIYALKGGESEGKGRGKRNEVRHRRGRMVARVDMRF